MENVSTLKDKHKHRLEISEVPNNSDLDSAQKVVKASSQKENYVQKKRLKGGRSKRRNKSDPAISNISELLSNNLLIISPEKLVNQKNVENEVISMSDALTEQVESELNESVEKLHSCENEVKLKTTKSPTFVSPRAQKRFKECNQQSNLNTFLQLKSCVQDLQKSDQDNDSKKLRISSNLFKLPSRRKVAGPDIQEDETSQEQIKKAELAETCVINGEVIVNNTNIEHSIEIVTENSMPCSKTVKENIVACAEESKAKSIETENNVDSNNVIEIIDELEDQTSAEKKVKLLSPHQNVFQFMMDARNKSIGQNTSGKNPESISEATEDSPKNKSKLAQRRAQLEKWNNAKGGGKRKLEDEERDLQIAVTMEKRAKRLKKLLNNSADDFEETPKRKPGRPKGSKNKKKNDDFVETKEITNKLRRTRAEEVECDHFKGLEEKNNDGLQTSKASKDRNQTDEFTGSLNTNRELENTDYVELDENRETVKKLRKQTGLRKKGADIMEQSKQDVDKNGMRKSTEILVKSDERGLEKVEDTVLSTKTDDEGVQTLDKSKNKLKRSIIANNSEGGLEKEISLPDIVESKNKLKKQIGLKQSNGKNAQLPTDLKKNETFNKKELEKDEPSKKNAFDVLTKSTEKPKSLEVKQINAFDVLKKSNKTKKSEEIDNSDEEILNCNKVEKSRLKKRKEITQTNSDRKTLRSIRKINYEKTDNVEEVGNLNEEIVDRTSEFEENSAEIYDLVHSNIEETKSIMDHPKAINTSLENEGRGELNNSKKPNKSSPKTCVKSSVIDTKQSRMPAKTNQINAFDVLKSNQKSKKSEEIGYLEEAKDANMEENKMKKRKRNFRVLYSDDEISNQSKKTRRKNTKQTNKTIIDDSDSAESLIDSDDEPLANKLSAAKREEVVIEDAVDVSEIFKKESLKRVQTALSSFFGLLSPNSSSSSDCIVTKKKRGRKPKLSLKQTDESSNSNESFKPKRRGRKPKLSLKVLEDSDNSKSSASDVTFEGVLENPEARRSSRQKKCHNYEEIEEGKLERKVAPVFAKAMPKPKLDPLELEARKNFLYSGVPNAIKKTIEKQKSAEEVNVDIFPTTSHIFQKEGCLSDMWNLPRPQLKLLDQQEYNIIPEKLCCGSVTKSNHSRSIEITLKPPQPSSSCDIISEIKAANPGYPVYRTYKILREKNGFKPKPPEPKKKRRSRTKKSGNDDCVIIEDAQTVKPSSADGLMWTEKYKPNSSREVVGNAKSLAELKKWLENWVDWIREMNDSSKRKRMDDSESEFENFDTDSRDARLPENTKILRGPTGSGKTTAVYAVCEELGINVLELNASSKRTGKRLLQELQEATQSHQVRNKDSNTLSTLLKSKDQPNQDASSQKICLLLIEDFDIVFDQDDGFISALTTLLATSKRPVVLITSDVDGAHVPKFLSQYTVVPFTALSAKTLATWLQIVCVLEGLKVDRNSLGELLEWNRGDARRTLLQLQFWAQSGGDMQNFVRSENAIHYIREYELDDCLEDDDSLDVAASNHSNHQQHENILESFLITNREEFSLPFPLNLSILWWNLPSLLDFPPINHNKQHDKPDAGPKDRLSNISKLFEALSFADSFARSEGLETDSEPCMNNWQEDFKDSLHLNENLWQPKTDKAILNDLTHSLLEGHCRLCKTETRPLIDMTVPVAGERRWRSGQHECADAYSGAVPLVSLTDHSAFALDYFPALRSITRTETKRETGNQKRGNRFYNYLRTLNMNLSRSSRKTACSIFN